MGIYKLPGLSLSLNDNLQYRFTLKESVLRSSFNKPQQSAIYNSTHAFVSRVFSLAKTSLFTVSSFFVSGHL